MTNPKGKDYFYGLGRRKEATARVRVKSGKGTITINNLPAEDYLDKSASLLSKLNAPFRALEQENKFDITVVVSGGGVNGQIDAIALGISKALVLMNEEIRGTLKRAGLLGRDPRTRERKKFGFRTARKPRQFTKR